MPSRKLSLAVKKSLLLEACRRSDLIPGPGFDIPALYRLLCFIDKIGCQGINLQGKKILDAACGYGAFSLYLSFVYPTASIKSVDTDPIAINYVKAATKSGKIKNVAPMMMNLEDLNAHDEFGLIIASDVLEHVENDLALLRILVGALKKSGYLYINVPFGNPKLKVNDVSADERKLMVRYGHVRQGYDLESLRRLLKKADVTLVEMCPEGSYVIDFLHYLWGYFYENCVSISDNMFQVILELMEFHFKNLRKTKKKSNIIAIARR